MTCFYVDTNIVIYYLSEDIKLAGFLEGKRVALSFVSEIELLSWPMLKSKDKEIVNDFIDNSLLIDYSSRLKNTVIKIRQEYKLKLGDAFIAATALNYDLPLMSSDPAFKKISNLNFILYKLK